MPLEDVAKDVYQRDYKDKYPDYNAWKKEKGIDQALSGSAPTFEDKLRTATDRVAPKGESGGIIKSFLQGGAEGITAEIPSMIGGALQFTGSHLPFKGIEKAGKSLKDWAEEKRQELYGPEIERTGLDRIVYEGTKMLAPSIIPGGVVGTAARGLKIAKTLKSATNIGAGAAAGLFGLSQAQQTKDTAEQAGVDPGLAPYATGAIEAAGEFLGTKFLAKLFRLDESVVKEFKATEFVKDLIKTIGIEVGTEIGQQAGEAGVEKYSGIRPEASPVMEAIDVIGPTAFMTILTGGLAGASNKLRSESPEEREASQYIEKLKAGAMFSMAIHEGMTTGAYEGTPFTPDHAIEIIKKAHKEGIFDERDIDRFKDKYPQLRDGLNGLIAENVTKKIDEAVTKEPTKPLTNTIRNLSDVPDFTPQSKEEIPPVSSEKIKTLQNQIRKQEDYLARNANRKGETQYEKWAADLEQKKSKLAELMKPAEVKGGDQNGTLQTEAEVENVAPTAPAAGTATPEVQTWFRGIDQVNKETGDHFFSGDETIAGNFGKVSKLEAAEMPKNPLVVGSKEELVEAIGYKHDPMAEPKDIPKEERFDVLAKKYAQEQGHDGIVYQNGTMEAPELHVFGKEEALPAPLSQTDAATVGVTKDEAKSGESLKSAPEAKKVKA